MNYLLCFLLFWTTVFISCDNDVNKGTVEIIKPIHMIKINDTIHNEDKQNKYTSIQIGSQFWMTENLNTFTFRNGDTISQVESAREWIQADKEKRPAWCYYENSFENGKKYKKLYNWHAVNDPRGLAPKGWKIPSNKEWEQLIRQLGGLNVLSKKMMSINGWVNYEGTNNSGFNAYPGGGRFLLGKFKDIGTNAYFWSSIEEDHKYDNTERSLLFSLNDDLPMLTGFPKGYGLSVRCIKD